MLLYAYMYLNICIHVCSLHPQVDLPKPTVTQTAELHQMPALPEVVHGMICRHTSPCHDVAQHELGTSVGTITAKDPNIASLHIGSCDMPVEEVDRLLKGLQLKLPFDR